jgi:TolB-like protein
MLDRSPKSYQRFFAELKRRHVFRVMAVYGATAFVLLQVADLLGQGMGLPDVVLKVTTFALLIGFPVAVVLAWAFEQTPHGFRRTESADPEEIERIVAQPALRRWPSGVLALVGVAALVGGAWWAGRQTALRPVMEGTDLSEMRLATTDVEHENRPSIAVLPFEDMSPRGDQEYFSDGITEELLNTLAKIRDLKVMARTSAFAFKGKNLDIRAVGDSLGARYVVEGSVRKADDQLRITAQLIDAADGAHVWSESYDRRLENVFQIQREIAEAIAGALRVPLGLHEDEQLVSPTDDLEAYDLYLTGRARMRERGQSVLEAIDLFEAAIARDSNWAPAWAGLAESLTLVPYYTSATRDSALWAVSLAAAQRAAERALELDPTNPSALVALGSAHRERWQWKEAEAAFARALSIDPGNVEGIQQYAEFLPYVGRMDDAYRAAQQALALDRSPIRFNAAGYTARLNGFYDEAIALLSQGIEADPEGKVWQLRDNLRHVNLQKGNWPEYRRLLVDAIQREDPERATRLQSIWPESESPTPTIAAWVTDFWSRREGAMIWMALEDHRRALDALERYIERDVPPFSSSTPLLVSAYDPIRDEPRFRAILARRGLEGLRLERLERADTP